MKKLIKISAALLIVIIIGIPLFHYYCDDVYELFVFSKSDVVQVNESTYICSKDEYEDFLIYMKNDGWEEVDQMGACIILEKDGKRIDCFLEIKRFYSRWTIEQSDILI